MEESRISNILRRLIYAPSISQSRARIFLYVKDRIFFGARVHEGDTEEEKILGDSFAMLIKFNYGYSFFEIK